jgi:hypothetical protein
MTQSNPNIETKSGVLHFFSNPYIGILGSVASIIGVFIAIYFYSISKQFRELVYFVNPAKAVVVKTGETSKLKFSFDNNEIKSDVTAAQIAIWNQGNEPIKMENILSQVKITTNPPVQILETIIRKTSRDVIKFDFEQSLANNGTIPLKWNILEKGDGVIVQIIYTGDTNIKISLEGVIEGQAAPKEIKYQGSILSPTEQVTRQKSDLYWSLRGVLFVLLLLIIMLFIGFRKLKNYKKVKGINEHPLFRNEKFIKYEERFLLRNIIYPASIMLFIVIVVVIVILFQNVPEPPFGF